MRARAFVLAMTYLAAALAVLLWGPLLPAEWYRRALFWALPLLVGLLAVLILPAPAARTAGGWPSARLLVAAVAAFAVAQSALPIAMRLGWLTFTYGDQALEAAPLLALAWSLPAALLLGILGWERGLRRTLYDALAATAGPSWAWGVTLACGLALALPALVPGLVATDRAFVLAGLVVALCREAALLLLYLRGGLVLAGAGRALLMVFDAIGLNDILSPHFPAANYVVGDPRFYVLRSIAALVALAVVAWGCRAGAAPQSKPTAGPRLAGSPTSSV